VQDWDAPAGAISWDRLITFLRRVRETGEIPPDHRSHDHLNEQTFVPIPDELKDSWIAEFQRIKEEREAAMPGTKIVWVMVDGFLLYWHKVGRLFAFGKPFLSEIINGSSPGCHR
jgi:nicotinamide/nicotinate riboside kinase